MAAGCRTCQVQCCVHNSFLFYYAHGDDAVDTKPLRRARSVDNYQLPLKRKIQSVVCEFEKHEVSTQDQPNSHLADQNCGTQHASGDVAAASDDHARGEGATEHHAECTSQGSISGGKAPSKISKGHLVDHTTSALETQLKKAKRGKVKRIMIAPAPASVLGSMKQLLVEEEASPTSTSSIAIRRAVPDDSLEITLMFRHIACGYSQSDVARIFGDAGLGGKFNFLYLPLNSARTANLGYLFVNFIKPEYAERCSEIFHGRVFGPRNTSKICEVCLSHKQGLAAIKTIFEKRKLPRVGRNAHRMLNIDQERIQMPLDLSMEQEARLVPKDPVPVSSPPASRSPAHAEAAAVQR